MLHIVSRDPHFADHGFPDLHAAACEIIDAARGVPEATMRPRNAVARNMVMRPASSFRQRRPASVQVRTYFRFAQGGSEQRRPRLAAQLGNHRRDPAVSSSSRKHIGINQDTLVNMLRKIWWRALRCAAARWDVQFDTMLPTLQMQRHIHDKLLRWPTRDRSRTSSSRER